MKKAMKAVRALVCSIFVGRVSQVQCPEPFHVPFVLGWPLLEALFVRFNACPGQAGLRDREGQACQGCCFRWPQGEDHRRPHQGAGPAWIKWGASATLGEKMGHDRACFLTENTVERGGWLWLAMGQRRTASI